MTITVNGNVQASGWPFMGISGPAVYSEIRITKADTYGTRQSLAGLDAAAGRFDVSIDLHTAEN
ncbi:MAG: hypothetical protein AB7F35_24455 [Acetobacteraceae bacterium]